MEIKTLKEIEAEIDALVKDGKLSFPDYGHIGNGIYKLPGGGYCGKAAWELFLKEFQKLGKSINTES